MSIDTWNSVQVLYLNELDTLLMVNIFVVSLSVGFFQLTKQRASKEVEYDFRQKEEEISSFKQVVLFWTFHAYFDIVQNLDTFMQIDTWGK